MAGSASEPAGRPSAGDAFIERVIVGVDDDAAGLAALAEAIRLARMHRAQLVAIRAWALGLPRHGGRRMRRLSHPHVVLSFSGEEQREASRMLVRGAFASVAGGLPGGLQVTIETPEGDPAVLLVSFASLPGDLLVLGKSTGHLARRLVHGSVTSYVTQRARCPVIIVPAEDGVAVTA